MDHRGIRCSRNAFVNIVIIRKRPIIYMIFTTSVFTEKLKLNLFSVLILIQVHITSQYVHAYLLPHGAAQQ